MGWDYGTELVYLQSLCEIWRNQFDWRVVEARFNAFPQFMTEIDGEQVHFYHSRSPEPDALPLIITHGFRGSVVEFLDVVGPLTDPVRHGGDPRDAFHVVAPSIPGYGFSGPTRHKGFTLQKAAAINVRLMELLGYDRYVPQGGVLKSFVTKKRDKAAALALVKQALKRHGMAEKTIADGMRFYPAAMRELANLERREMGRWLNNRVENSHLPFRRRERAMQRFRQMKSLQKFALVHASFHNHFNSERRIVDRQTYKTRRSVALAKWQNLLAQGRLS